MHKRSLADWLTWQATLNPAEIELGLERIATVLERLQLPPPPKVLTVAGTNGKGSTVNFLDRLLRANQWRTGVYTSPHLRRYNERVRLNGLEASDSDLMRAFAQVDQARAEIPLTYFEFGTLAGLCLFAEAQLDAWILEVGLGGRLDAVNIVDPDVSLITTVDFDHQEWLGDSLEEIAAEKAGIMRAGRPALYGDEPVPQAVTGRAAKLGADLLLAGHDFGFRRAAAGRWCWRGPGMALDALPIPAPGDDAQLRNASLALAALASLDAALLDQDVVTTALSAPPPPGRCQRIQGRPEWLLDVAHNPQAARVLAQRCAQLPPVAETTVVLGLLADKSVDGVVAALAPLEPLRWITCTTASQRGREAQALAERLRALGLREVSAGGSVAEALADAARASAADGRIIVCGSFMVVGPALDWLAMP